MSDHGFLDDIFRGVELIKTHAPDGYTVQEIASISAPFLCAAAHVAEQVGNGNLDWQAIKEAALEIYDTKLAAIDLTGKWYESMVDSILRNILEGAFDKLVTR